MWRGQRSRTLVIGAACAAFAVCSVLPIAYLLATTLGQATNVYGPLILDSRQRSLLLNTAVLGIGTALVASAVGVPLGVALARVPLHRKAGIRLVAAAPILLPPYVVALAWIYAGSSGGLVTAILVLSLIFYPLSMLTTEAALRQVDGRLEEAASMVAAPRRVLWHITLPLVAPSIAAAALIIFVLAVSEFGVPALMRVRVYTTEVFTAFAAFYDFGRAIVLAVPLLLVCAAVAAAATVVLGDRIVTTRRSIDASPVVFDAWRRPATGAVALITGIAVGLPVFILAREATGAGSSLVAALAGSSDAIVNSLVFAAVGATLAVAVAVWLGYAQARASHTSRLATQALLIVLFAVPSTIVGVGLIGLWNRPGLLGALYGTDVMFVLAYLARFVPVATLILAASTRTVSESQEEAAAVSGAGWFRAMLTIVLPQTRLGIAAAWLVAFVLAFGELGASILVAPPGEATLPIRVYTLIANAPPSHVATLALLQSLVVFTPVAALGLAASLREVR